MSETDEARGVRQFPIQPAKRGYPKANWNGRPIMDETIWERAREALAYVDWATNKVHEHDCTNVIRTALDAPEKAEVDND